MKLTQEIKDKIDNHFNSMDADTFIHLLQDKYGIELIDFSNNSFAHSGDYIAISSRLNFLNVSKLSSFYIISGSQPTYTNILANKSSQHQVLSVA